VVSWLARAAGERQCVRRIRFSTMSEIVTFNGMHPLVGTWKDADENLGTSVQFTIGAAGSSFEVAGVDTSDGEILSISNVRWDGQHLSFESTVPSTGHHVGYALKVISPSEVMVRYTMSERWVRADTTA
jgi:hypothetical protein